MTKSKQEHSGYLGDLSESQKNVLELLKNHLETLGVKDPIYDDWKQLRFCRTKKFNLAQVKTMIEKEVKFREQYDIENILHLDWTVREKMEEFYICGFSGISKEGQPVRVERMKTFNFKKMFEFATLDDSRMGYSVLSEETLNCVYPYCSKMSNKRIEKKILIYDLEGADLSSIIFNSEARKVLKVVTSTVEDNYPSDTEYWVVNAPFAFTALWAIVKRMISDSSANRVKVYGSGYKKDLHEKIDKSQLPDFQGGDVKDFPKNNLPWNDYLKYCHEKKTFYPQNNVRFSDPLKIAQLNSLDPIQIEKSNQFDNLIENEIFGIENQEGLDEGTISIKIPQLLVPSEKQNTQQEKTLKKSIIVKRNNLYNDKSINSDDKKLFSIPKFVIKTEGYMKYCSSFELETMISSNTVSDELAIF